MQKFFNALSVLALLVALGASFLSVSVSPAPPSAPVMGGSQALGVTQIDNLRVLKSYVGVGPESHTGAETHIGSATFTTITADVLVSQTVGFNATGSSNFLTTTLNGPVTLSQTAALIGAVTARNSVQVTGTLAVSETSNLVGNVTAGGNVAATGDVSARNISATGVISLAGSAFSGPIKHGAGTTITNGQSISHGFATTPTACVATPTDGVTASVSITSTSFAVSLPGGATHTVYWFCGK